LPAGPLHERFELPNFEVEVKVIVVGPREQMRPVGTVLDSVTVPVNPLMADTVIVEFASLLAKTAEEAGIALTLKSTPAAVTFVEAVRDPDVPVTVIVAEPGCDPGGNETVRVAFAFTPCPIDTKVGVNVVWKPHVHPLDVAPRFTWPLKLPRLVTVIVVLAEPPSGIIKLFGLADRENPLTSTVTVVECVGLQSGAQTVTM
jgi:hypothetical protein